MTAERADAATREPDGDDERTPLLTNGHSQAKPHQLKATPLPYASVFTLCFCRLVEPIAFTVIFPFVNQMVEDTGIDPAEVGYRAGLIESLYTLAQFLTILPWGRLSDRIGRKPVLLMGMAGASTSVLLFGFSKTFVMMLIARALAGLLNGNIGVLKSSMAELTDATNEAKAFTFLSPAWTTGAALGPIIGGYLANPAERYPSVFGDSAFLRDYKYFLPCFVGACGPVIGVAVSWFLLKESLPSKVAGKATDVQKSQPELPSIRSVLTKRVFITLCNYAMLAFCSMSIVGIVPLFLYTPSRLGGAGFAEAQIGKAMSISAVGSTTYQLLFFQPLQRRLGTIGTFRLAVVLYPIGSALFPLTSHFARIEHEAGQGLHKTWIILIVQLTVLSLANIAYGCNMLLINASSPSPNALGTLNGVAQMTAALVRTAALAIGPSLFALTIQRQWLHGQAIFFYMIALGIGVCCTSWLVTDDRASWRDEPAVDARSGSAEDEA